MCVLKKGFKRHTYQIGQLHSNKECIIETRWNCHIKRHAEGIPHRIDSFISMCTLHLGKWLHYQKTSTSNLRGISYLQSMWKIPKSQYMWKGNIVSTFFFSGCTTCKGIYCVWFIVVWFSWLRSFTVDRQIRQIDKYEQDINVFKVTI